MNKNKNNYRSLEERLKARQLPEAKRLISQLRSILDEMDNLRILADHKSDEYSYIQLKYRAFVNGYLTENEALALRGYQMKLGIEEDVKYVIASK